MGNGAIYPLVSVLQLMSGHVPQSPVSRTLPTTGANAYGLIGEEGEEQNYSGEAKGSYRGRQVHVINIAAMVNDAAEEMSFAAEERMGTRLAARRRNDKNAAETRRSSGKGGAEKADDKEEAGENHETVDAITDSDIGQFLGSFKHDEETPPEEIIEQARERFPDITDQYALIRKAGGKVDPESPLADSLTRAEGRLLRDQAPHIYAGLNVEQDAQQAVRDGLGDRNSVRQFYRDSVLEFSDASDLFSKVVAEYGAKGFEKAVHFLIQGSGHDLAARQSSMPREHLQAVIDQLYVVEVLGQTHSTFEELLRTVQREFGESGPEHATQLMQDILKLSQARWVTADSVQDLAKDSKINGVESRIYFLTSAKEQMRLIPVKIYPSPENRNRLLEATQEALDAAIERDT